jgi:hypothetical protein
MGGRTAWLLRQTLVNLMSNGRWERVGYSCDAGCYEMAADIVITDFRARSGSGELHQNLWRAYQIWVAGLNEKEKLFRTNAERIYRI